MVRTDAHRPFSLPTALVVPLRAATRQGRLASVQAVIGELRARVSALIGGEPGQLADQSDERR